MLTASYGILGRSAEDYESGDVTRAVELLDALGCAHLIRRRFATLSEGERKRVQIARSLMPDPELLLLDEPAAGLDLGGREDLLRRIAALCRDPKAPMMVMVTHHVEEVPPGFTHALLLRKGAVLAAGKVQDVFTARHLSKCFGLPLLVERAGTGGRRGPPRCPDRRPHRDRGLAYDHDHARTPWASLRRSRSSRRQSRPARLTRSSARDR